MDSPHQFLQPQQRWRNWLALLLGPGLIYAAMIVYSSVGVVHSNPWAPYAEQASATDWVGSYWRGVAMYFVVGGGWLCLLLYLLCREKLADLQARAGQLGSDLLHMLALLAVDFVLLDPLWQFSYPYITRLGLESDNLSEMFGASASSPSVLWVSMGPYNWLAAAAFEELLRVFMLSRFQRLFPLALSRGFVPRAALALLAATLFGLCHIYQGLSGVVHAFGFGLLAASYYLVYGRVWPLILAHGIYGNIAELGGMIWAQGQGG